MRLEGKASAFMVLVCGGGRACDATTWVPLKVEHYVGEIKGGMKPSMKLTIMGVLSANPSSLSTEDLVVATLSSEPLRLGTRKRCCFIGIHSSCLRRISGFTACELGENIDYVMQIVPRAQVIFDASGKVGNKVPMSRDVNQCLDVSLLCSPVDPNADVALLFTVNFQEKSVTRNARIAEEWGKEEKSMQYFPFTAGDIFKMEIICERQQFRILVDGHQLCDFTHRVKEIQTVTALKISGDARLTKVA